MKNRTFVALGILVTGAAAVCLMPECQHILESKKYAERNAATNASLKKLAVAFAMYADSNGGLLPPENRWATALLASSVELRKDDFQPLGFEEGYVFSFNEQLGCRPIDTVPNEIVVISQTSKELNKTFKPPLRYVAGKYKPWLLYAKGEIVGPRLAR